MSDVLGAAVLRLDVDRGPLTKGLAGAQAESTGAFSRMAGSWKRLAMVGVAGVGAALAGVGVAAVRLGQDFDRAYDTIRVGTGATGKALEGLRRDFREVIKDVPASFDDASTAIADLNTRLGLTGKPLQERTKQFLELSRINNEDLGGSIRAVTRLFGDWSVRTGDQRRVLDQLFRTSQATGISVTELSTRMVDFGSPLRNLGIRFDFAAAMFARFEKEGVNTMTLMPGLKFAIKNMAQPTDELAKRFERLGINARRPEEGLMQTFEAIKRATPDKAKILAFEIFGARAGPDMAAAIREGRFDLDELMRTIRNGRDTIMGAGRETMDFGERWTLIKNRVFVALEPLVIRLFDAMGRGMDKLAIATDWLQRNAGPAWADVRRAIADVIAVIDGPLTAVLGFVLGAARKQLAGIVQAFQGAFELIRGIIDIFAGLFTGDFNRMWKGIKGLFGGALDYLVGLLRATTAPLRHAGELMTRGIIKGVKAVPRLLAEAGRWVLHRIIDAFRSLPGLLRRAARWYLDTLVSGVKAFRGSWAGLGTWVLARIVDGVTTIGGGIAGVGRWIRARIGEFVRAIPDAFRNIGGWVLARIVDGVTTIGGGIANVGNWIRARIAESLREVAKGFRSAGGAVIGWIVDGIKGGANKLVGFLNAIIDKINILPAVNIGDIPRFAAGGLWDATRGGVARRPMAIVGEEAPEHPEYVIPTNPRWRGRALDLLDDAVEALTGQRLAYYARGGRMARTGGPLDVAKDAGRAALGALPVPLPLKLLLDGGRALIGELPKPSVLPRWMQGLGGWIVGKITGWIKDRAGELTGGGGLGNFPPSWEAIGRLAAAFGLTMTSGYRPGDDGYHGVNRAKDWSNGFGPTPQMLKFAQTVAGVFGSKMLELIYTPLGWGIKNGVRVPPYAAEDHYDHVHTAFRKGGVFGRLPYFGGGGVVPGPVGSPQPIIAHGGETIGTPEVHVHFADGMEWLRDFIRVVIRNGNREVRQVALAGVRPGR